MENLNELLKLIVPREWLLSVMPVPASTHAGAIDYLFWFLIVTCGILFLLVVIPLFLIVVRYRRKSFNQRAESQKDHNFWLESLWTFVPLVYLGILFVWGFLQYLDMYVAPHDAMELRVVGQKWQWAVDYPKEEISVAGVGATIGIPVNRPVRLVMGSQDVIHSFYIPNFRVKQDVVPGRYAVIWFEADKIGEYPVLCAEYCGDSHSTMLATVKVMSETDYNAWVEGLKAQSQNLPLGELGEKLYSKLGCIACHTTDGTIKIGPSFKGLYGKTETLADGSSVKVDDKFIYQKLMTPQKQTVKGFPPVMPTFQGRVSERDISAIIEFIKVQSGQGTAEKP